MKKRCTKCLRYKFLDEYTKNKRAPFEKDYHCKTCMIERRYIFKHGYVKKGPRKNINTGMKTCVMCHETKYITEFYVSRKIPLLVETQCKVCRRKYWIKHRQRKTKYILKEPPLCSWCHKNKCRRRRIICEECRIDVRYDFIQKDKESLLKKYAHLHEQILKKTPKIVKTEKECPRCKETKNTNDFYICNNRKDGRKTYCKECQLDLQRIDKNKSKRYYFCSICDTDHLLKFNVVKLFNTTFVCKLCDPSKNIEESLQKILTKPVSL